MRWLPLLVLCACHASVDGGTVAGIDGGDSDSSVIGDDAQIDALVLGAWGAPAPIISVNTTVNEDDGTLSWSGTELVFARQDGTSKHLYFSTLVNGTWSTPVKATFSTDVDHRDESPRYASDDLTLYFGSSRLPSNGGSDLYKITRPSTTSPWTLPATKLDALSGATTEKWLAPCAAAYLMVRVSANAETEIYGGMGLGAPTKVTELDSAVAGANETGTYLTPDCLTTYFSSTRDGLNDLWTSTRPAVGMPWATPTKVTDFGTAGAEQDPFMANDRRTFVFASDLGTPGDVNLYMSTR